MNGRRWWRKRREKFIRDDNNKCITILDLVLLEANGRGKVKNHNATIPKYFI